MYSAIDIAKFIITFCTEINKPISNLHLQKILYYLQVHYAKRGRRLFTDEIYAWQYGPVVPEIYYLFAGYGASKITNRYTTNIASDIKAELEELILKLIEISPWDLVQMTHTKGDPWDKIYNGGRGINKTIDFSLLAADSIGE